MLRKIDPPRSVMGRPPGVGCSCFNWVCGMHTTPGRLTPPDSGSAGRGGSARMGIGNGNGEWGCTGLKV